MTSRRFRLGDGMVLIAALAPGLLLIRAAAGLGLFEARGAAGPGGLAAPFARQLVEFLHVGVGCLLTGLVPAVLALGLFRAGPSRREAARGIGLTTCIVALLAAILPLLSFAGRFAAEARSPAPSYAVLFNNSFVRWILEAGPMILGAWAVRGIQGRWRPEPTWADRAGCALGACLVVAYLYSQLYFALVPIFRW